MNSSYFSLILFQISGPILVVGYNIAGTNKFVQILNPFANHRYRNNQQDSHSTGYFDERDWGLFTIHPRRLRAAACPRHPGDGQITTEPI